MVFLPFSHFIIRWISLKEDLVMNYCVLSLKKSLALLMGVIFTVTSWSKTDKIKITYDYCHAFQEKDGSFEKIITEKENLVIKFEDINSESRLGITVLSVFLLLITLT